MSENVLLVTADSVRADYCGFLGGPDTTPFLDEFAEESVIYENAIAPGPRTPSSVPISMTGERFRASDADSNQGRLERVADHVRRFETIPERLSKEGYSTAAITANPWTTGTTGFDELFDEFVEIGTGHGDAAEHTSTVDKLADFANQWRQKTDWFAQWPAFYDDVLDTIDELEEPWFVWVFLLDPHSPYIVPRADRTESNLLSMYYSAIRYNLKVMRSTGSPDVPPHMDTYLQESYRDAIRSVDRFLETIVGEIPADTSLLFHSDHGEAFGDHGTYGHQEVLFEENVHVPLLVHNGRDSGRTARPISVRNVAGIAADLATEDFNPDEYVRDFVFSTTEFGEERSVRTPSHAAIVRGDDVELTGRQSGLESTPVSEDAAASFRDLVECEFARDRERSRVVAAAADVESAESR